MRSPFSRSFFWSDFPCDVVLGGVGGVSTPEVEGSLSDLSCPSLLDFDASSDFSGGFEVSASLAKASAPERSSPSSARMAIGVPIEIFLEPSGFLIAKESQMDKTWRNMTDNNFCKDTIILGLDVDSCLVCFLG